MKGLVVVSCLSVAAFLPAAEIEEPFSTWQAGVKIRPVSKTAGRHTIHTYYLLNPESPDGQRLLFFASTTPEGEHGDLIVLDRATGQERVITRGIDTEDAHRAACQQWTDGGRRVAYHAVKDGHWSVHVIDLETGKDRILAEDRQLSFGRPDHDVVPIYGPHWHPGQHRDLELLNVVTGEIRTVLTMADVERQHGEWLTRELGDKPRSIAFPAISPDGKRVIFKISAQSPDVTAHDFKSPKLSKNRIGLLAYDLATKKPLFAHDKWGHPAWHPDSRRVLQRGHIFYDLNEGGKLIDIPGLPRMTEHPSVSPDGRLFVTDGRIDHVGGPAGYWGVAVGDIRGEKFRILHRFDNSQGAKSWRRNHPHPIFSHDSKRIYFNVNEGPWTQLYVAEVAGPSSGR